MQSSSNPAPIGEFIEYNPATGLLHWKRDRSNVKAGSRAGNPIGNRGYVAFHFNGRKHYAHRVAWLLARGPIPAGCDIDHINGDRSDNRIDNLRLATRGQNLCNGRARGKASRFKGVSYHAQRGRWRAFVNARHLGLFDNEEDAARAADRGALEQYGEFARLNFPEEASA